MRQDESRRDETRQDKTRRDKTRQDETRQDETRRDKTRQEKMRRDKTEQKIKHKNICKSLSQKHRMSKIVSKLKRGSVRGVKHHQSGKLQKKTC